MKGIAGGFQTICAFLFICCKFFIHSKIKLFGRQNLGQISLWNMSSLERATWSTCHWTDRFMFRSYSSIPLNGLQDKGFLKIFTIFWKITITIFVKFHRKILEKNRTVPNSKTIKNFEIYITACPTAIKSSTPSKVDNFFFPETKIFYFCWWSSADWIFFEFPCMTIVL